MNRAEIRVSLGMPVYNGEAYIEQTLDAILAQTFQNFELIISDNASTDRTEEICRAYAAKDSRIRYCRHEQNRGPAWNHNYVFEVSKGEYFKWAAHDDLFAPELLEKCVAVMEQNPAVVLCDAKANVIDECDGRFRGKYDIQLHTDLSKPQERLHGLIFGDRKLGDHRCYQIYGLIRSEVLAQTSVMGNYAHADGVLLVELALRGPFHEIPEYLFFPRVHPQQSTRIALSHYHLYSAWFDPAKRGKVSFPRWRILREYFRAVSEAPLSGSERLLCYLHLLNWFRKKRARLTEDLIVGIRFIRDRLLPRSTNRGDMTIAS